MKRIVKVLSLLMVLALVCVTFAGCNHIDDLRARQAFWEGEDIRYGEYLYKELPYYEYLQPLYDESMDAINVTESDVPVLLSSMAGSNCYISSNGIFLRCNRMIEKEDYYTTDEIIYCREDKYDEVKLQMRKQFRPLGYCYSFDFFDGYRSYDEELCMLTEEQSVAVDEVLGTEIIQTVTSPASMKQDYYVDLQEYSFDGLFRRDANIRIIKSDMDYYVLEGRNYEGEYTVYEVPFYMNDIFKEIMSKEVDSADLGYDDYDFDGGYSY